MGRTGCKDVNLCLDGIAVYAPIPGYAIPYVKTGLIMWASFPSSSFAQP